MNLTLISMIIASHFSISPFYSVPRSFNDHSTTEITNSYFSFSFSNILYSTEILHETLIKQNTFSFILKSSLYFSKADKPTVIKGKTYDSQYEHDVKENQGKIMIVGCKFNKCKAEKGGGLLIKQNCYLILHGTIFLECEATGNGGGAYICGGFGNYISDTKDFNDVKIQKIDIQYCCFNRCLSRKDNNDAWKGYGASSMVAGQTVKFLFTTSTSHFQSKEDYQRSRGAQFDIQSNEINLEFVNVTEAYSEMCCGIEFRHTTKGLIKYQTFYLNDSPCLEMFSNLNNDGIVVTEINMIENVLRKYDNNYPGMIYTRDASIEISNCFISGTKISDNLKLAIKEAVKKNYNDITIKLVNFNVWGFEHNQEGDYIRENVSFRGDQAYFIPISYLGLNECAGNMTVAPLIITSIFTNSALFSRSKIFTNSNGFSKSREFSKTDEFTRTGQFTKTTAFSDTDEFSKTDVFTFSFYFTESAGFEKTIEFSKSDVFSKTSGFSETKEFTFTGQFTKTTSFSDSKKFSKSDWFSSSFYFSESVGFSKSNEFSQTSGFSKTKEFTLTGQFTKTGFFTSSKDFSQSHIFTRSKDFDASATFTPSNTFTKSAEFTNSIFFSQSTQFSYSSFFSNSLKFSLSKHFTFSDNFADSSQFTSSFYFTASGTFTASKQFTNSGHFTKSSTFHPSSIFTKSDVFENKFTPSKTMQNKVVISINESKSNNKAAIIGCAVAAAVFAVGLVVAIIAFIINRNRRLEQDSDIFLDLNPIEDKGSSITYNNVLHGFVMDDDPFEDDFHIDHH